LKFLSILFFAFIFCATISKRQTFSELQIIPFVDWVEAKPSLAGFRTATQPTDITAMQLLSRVGRNPT
jgi:hypothetical protein